MHLFTDYIQPITVWLDLHPHWALFFTFIISFAESLAIIGSIIPGTVTMTAIGILAGSGVMRIDLTLLAATLGAIAGDGASYMLGYTFRDRLATIWPFSRYPGALEYGKEYFKKHGGKSVLIGRFVGPLRSLIPVIAGMMQMSHLHFYIANIISAILWSVAHVVPGILIGAASSELTPERATRLFLFILLSLAAIWILSLIAKWLILRLNQFLRVTLHDFWSRSRQHPHLARLMKRITPADEVNHYPTAGLVVTFILFTGLLITLTVLVIEQTWMAELNLPIHLLLQSIRTLPFDLFFITLSQLTSTVTIVTVTLGLFCSALYYRDSRSLRFLASLVASCAIFLLLIHWLIASERPTGLLEVKLSRAYPSIQLTFATAIFLSFLFYVNNYCAVRFKTSFNLCIAFTLLLSGFAAIYLGDHWLSDVLGAYLAGICLFQIHWLFYRCKPQRISYPPLLAAGILSILFLAAAVSLLVSCKREIHRHQPYFAQYVFTEQRWWNQKKPILPIYRVNRFGKPVSLFNIQYAGSLNRLETALSAFGWHREYESLYQSILKRINKPSEAQDSPIMAQLYLNRKPQLVMTYKVDSRNTLILRLWRSNYHLKHYRQPLWIGSVQITDPFSNRPRKINPVLFYVRTPLIDFMQRDTMLPANPRENLGIDIEPRLLLIREMPAQDFLNLAFLFNGH